MRLSFRAFSRFRPRILTLIVFCLAAAVIALANLSFDEVYDGDGFFHHRSYGWPIIWHRLVLTGTWLSGGERTIGWYYSAPRLAANLALWFVLLAALAGTCEWLLRRYRPRPRWSLRTLLVVVGLVAAGCGWFAKARNRAAIQDQLPTRGSYGVPLVFVERSGPKWLDLLGMDRYRRRIVLASNWWLDSGAPDMEQHFLQLSRLTDVRHLTEFRAYNFTPTTAKALGSMQQLETLDIALDLNLDRLTPEFAAALSDLRQLRRLSIARSNYLAGGDYAADDDDLRLYEECLAAIGTMTDLETLELSNIPLRGASLACLASLKNLRSLHVDFWHGEWKGSGVRKPVAEDCLRAIAMLSQLEALSVEDLNVSNPSLACLASLTALKTLSLENLATDSRPMLSHLPALPRLEALDLSESNIDDDDLRRLAILPRLKSLKLGSYDREPRFTRVGIAALAAVESLEEVDLNGESPEGITALRAVKGLKKLHLGEYPSGSVNGEGVLTFDYGEELNVGDLKGFRRALAALRKSKSGIVIDTDDEMPVFWDRQRRLMETYYGLSFDAAPDRPSAWLPGGDTQWMTPLELADFEKSGGRASFSGATFPGEDDRLLTVEF